MKYVDFTCPVCSKVGTKNTGHYNRAMKLGANLYCSKECSSEARRSNKSDEQKKIDKSEYDKKYRDKNIDTIKKRKAEAFKIDYANNPEKYREQRKKRMPNHVIYCRQPKARAKEREARYRRLGQTKLKQCFDCKQEKRIIEFENYDVFPDKRNYICKECDKKQNEEFGMTTRRLLAVVRTALLKQRSILNVKDITPHPYMIEAYKYLLLLKQITK